MQKAAAISSRCSQGAFKTTVTSGLHDVMGFRFPLELIEAVRMNTQTNGAKIKIA